MTRRTRLLVSVRNPAEALAALAGGADLIDVKEPARGPLGRAGDAVITAVVRCIAGRRPVSAALGELAAEPKTDAPPGLRYHKWGLAGCGSNPRWQETLITLSQAGNHVPLSPCTQGERCRGKGVAASGCFPLTPDPSLPSTGERGQRTARFEDSADVCHLVPVAYADWRCAAAPSVEHVCAFIRRHGKLVLIDTFDKTAGATLLDYLSVRQISDLCRWCHVAGIQVALAGSLSAPHIKSLKAAGPDWFGVRGAACQGGRRDAEISARKVRELAELVRE
jgi:(5-formylfuran-3-yl)methyl phosphate synthase